MRISAFGTSILLISLCPLAGCLGPKPEIKKSELKLIDPVRAIYRLDVELKNASSGDGEVKVKAKLTDRKSGESVTENKHVDLGPHSTTQVRIEILTPVSDYDVDVTAEYPPH